MKLINTENTMVELSSAEFLSRYREDDKLAPVITLVLYYGEKEEWNGPTHIYDMLDFTEDVKTCEVIKSLVPDYKINLVELEKIDSKKFNTDLQIMFSVPKYRKDKVLLAKYIDEHREYFAKVDSATLDAGLSLLSFSGALVDKLENMWESEQQEIIRNVEGDYDMCKAIEDMINDGVEKGRQEGRREGRREGEILGVIETYKELGVSKEDAIDRIVVKFQLAEEDARETTEKHWKQESQLFL